MTYIEWDKQILGPISDTIGVEQGGCASDRIYRLVNNEQVKLAQDTQLGVDLDLAIGADGGVGRGVVSAVAQADDVALVSTSLRSLEALLHLTKLYCSRYQVKLVGSKTKLLVFTSKQTDIQSKVELAVTTISVDGVNISPSSQATHVGVVRSVDGNSSHISARLAAHRKAVFAVLRAGLAKGHKANPSACLRVESIFGMPVLLSGMSSLILSKADENMLDLYYKVHIQRLLKLHQSTPAPVVHFLAGTLPLRAHLHLRMLSLFGQLCRLREGDNILAVQASGVYSSADPSSRSWFWKLRQVCAQYGLPHPASWLVSKPTKLQVKKVTKSAVLEYWLAQLREKAESLSSLKYLQTKFLGLTRCHPLYWSCGSSPWEIEKATSQARLLSGRYRLEALSVHWVPWDMQGMCSLPLCWGPTRRPRAPLRPSFRHVPPCPMPQPLSGSS